jgi:hypothetical protein
MSCCMICSDNQVDSELLNASDYSSQQTLFPATNVLNNARAYKTWRSGGYYQVTTGNNTIIFRDSASTNLTGTIATGVYTSTSGFLAAVDTAFENAGVANYAITQNSTSFKNTFTSTLTGGATAFQLRADEAAFTARTILGLGSSAYTGATTYTSDTIYLHTEEWLEYDFGTPIEVQACIILGKARLAWQLSDNAVITLQLNETENWASPEFETTLTRTDWGAYTMDAEGLFAARRYARIKFSDPTNPNGYIEVSKIFLGEMVQFTKAAPQFGFTDAIEDLTITVDSIGGVTSANPYPMRSIINYELDFMTNADKELLQDVYIKYGKEKPLFFIFDDNNTLGATPQRLVKLMRFVDPPQFVKQNPIQWTATLRLKEEL